MAKSYKMEELGMEHRQAVTQLIEDLRNHPVLWDVHHEKYHNKNARNNAVAAILHNYQVFYPDANHEAVVKKISALRGAYRKERGKVYASINRGDGVHVPKLWYYGLMSFLENQGESRTASSIEDLLEESAQVYEDSSPTPCNGPTNPTPSTPVIVVPTTTTSSTTSNPIMKRRKLDNDTIILERIAQKLEDEDSEYKHYGLHIAERLRDVKRCAPIQAALASKLINDALYYAELGALNFSTQIAGHVMPEEYIPRNILPTRFQTYGLHAVIGFPRLRSGVPITLGRIPLLANRGNPQVEPFPNWDHQEVGNPDAFQNVVDLFLDEKKVLWLLDLGTVHTLEQPVRVSHPRVIGIHFLTKKILHEVNLSSYTSERGRLQYVVAENTMGRPFVYVSCSETCSLIVLDVKQEKGRVLPLPNPGQPGDVLYMTVLRPPLQPPMLAFSHLSYPVLFGLQLADLRQGNLGTAINLGEKGGEMVVLGTDNGSKLYFRWKDTHQVRVWDLAGAERGKMVGDGADLRACTQVTGGSRLLTWALESNFQDFVTGDVGSTGASACIRPLVKTE